MTIREVSFMNRLEFNEVLKAFDINDCSTLWRYGSNRTVYFWNGIEIYFGGSYYTVISGKVPLKVANTIYQKYPNNQYGIRINGGCYDYIPIDYAVDDKYKEEVKKHSLEESKKNLLERKNKNKYIEYYHIDSKEGLIILLSELKDYYARKQKSPEIEVQRYDKIVASVSAEILKKVNPSITTYDWMTADPRNSESFLSTIVRDEHTPFGYVFRKLVDQFDRTINPYINEDIELDSIENYITKINMNADTYDEENGMYRKNCCSMEITKDGKSKVSYYRCPEGFSYKLFYVLGPREYFSVAHYFSNNGDKESDKGEHIYIDYSGKNSKQKIDLRYNITKGLSGESYKDKTPVTPEQMIFVYDELAKAIELASTITIDNMKKKGYSKSLSNKK